MQFDFHTFFLTINKIPKRIENSYTCDIRIIAKKILKIILHLFLIIYNNKSKISFNLRHREFVYLRLNDFHFYRFPLISVFKGFDFERSLQVIYLNF